MLNMKFVDFLVQTSYKILVFIGGIFLGILLVLLIYLIISLVHKKLQKEKNIVQSLPTPEKDPNDEIFKYVALYNENYSDKVITERIKSLKLISGNLIKDIAKLYYPKSKEPYLEVSVESLLALTSRVIEKIEQTVNDIFNSAAFKLAWKSYVGFTKVKNIIRGLFKKEKEEELSLDIKELKISYIIAELEKMKSKALKDDFSKEEKEPTIDKSLRKRNYLLLDSFINNKITNLIKEIGNEAILVYGNTLPSSLKESGEVL